MIEIYIDMEIVIGNTDGFLQNVILEVPNNWHSWSKIKQQEYVDKKQYQKVKKQLLDQATIQVYLKD